MCFLSFLQLHSIKIIVKINNSPNITAKTITAGNAASTAAAIAAPIINPITTANDVNRIIATIPKQFLLLLHFSSLVFC